MQTKELPADYALVLQQLDEDGGDGFEDLAQTLRLDRGRLGHIIQSLQHKGLIVLRHGSSTREAWMSLSAKGHRFMTYVWPESTYAHGY